MNPPADRTRRRPARGGAASAAPARGPALRAGLARGTAALVALAIAAAPVHAQLPPVPSPQPLPALGDPISDDFGLAEERRLGDQIMREIRLDPAYGDDPLLLEYLQSLWQPLVAQARRGGQIEAELAQRFAWEAFLVRDRSVNAFALPGGYVGVHLGLIAMTTSRDELASVLAHELTHVSQRHIARGMVSSSRQSMLAVAGMVLGMIAASRANSADAANAVIAGSQAAAIQGQLNFSRDMEREADRIGYTIATGAGFAPAGMASMFEKLAQSSRLNDSGAYPYLRTHPLTTERIGEARARLGTDGTVAAPPPTLEHALMQGRARTLADTRVDALRRAQADDGTRAELPRAERLAAATGSAIASTLLREWAQADAALGRARALLREGGRGTDTPRAERGNDAARAERGNDTPRAERGNDAARAERGNDAARAERGNDAARAERALALIAAESLAARGDGAAALAQLAPYAGDASRPMLFGIAQAALVAPAGEPALKRSADELQTWVVLSPRDAGAWQLLGQLWAKLDQPLRALRAEAEARVALADLGGALDRLRAAQRVVRESGTRVDHIDASVIDARLREVEAQRRAQLAESRGRGAP